MQDKIEELIIKVLEAIWIGISWENYSQSTIKNIYPFFTSRIRASANQSATYERFVELLIQRMKSNTSSIPIIVDSEKEFLRRCRDETSYLIALFRQGIYEKQKKRKAKEKTEEKGMKRTS